MKSAARGFTLLEVVVALSILSISLVVLLQSQALSLQHSGRARDMSVATLLARSKMVDVQQRLFHDGFTANDEQNNGTFADEGHADILWKSRVSEVELDLSSLMGMCEGLASKNSSGKSDKSGVGQAANDCGSMMQSLAGGMGGLLTELSRSMRAAEVEVLWPVGNKQERIVLRALLTRDDFQTLQEGDAMRNMQQVQSAGEAAGLGSALPGGMGAMP